jgi:hypothetical protein
MNCETVKIENPKSKSGFTVINKDDFNPKKHKLFGDADTEAPIDLGKAPGDSFSDDELRSVIEDVTGKSPRANASRESLIKQFDELQAAEGE